MSREGIYNDREPVTSYPRRRPQPPVQTNLNLGPIAPLAGKWYGNGFNTIWRPDNTGDPNFAVRRFLQLNMTAETLVFDVIGSPIPNRGVANQKDIAIYGLNYLQKVRDNDCEIPGFPNAGEDLHIEPGLFLNVPQSGGVADANDPAVQVPVTPPSIVRLATIPHGVSVLLQGIAPSALPVPGKPLIPPVYPIAELADIFATAPSLTPAQQAQFTTDYNSFPASRPGQQGLGIQPANVPAQALAQGVFHAVPENTLAEDIPYPNANQAQSNGPFPAQWQDYVNDPNVLLRDAIAHQDILGHITISLKTPSPAAIGQIPFLGITDPALQATVADALGGSANAFVHSVTSTFWIEWVKADEYYSGPAFEHDNPIFRSLDPFHRFGSFLQLQYSQTVILNFNNVLWPHVSVATLQRRM